MYCHFPLHTVAKTYNYLHETADHSQQPYRQNNGMIVFAGRCYRTKEVGSAAPPHPITDQAFMHAFLKSDADATAGPGQLQNAAIWYREIAEMRRWPKIGRAAFKVKINLNWRFRGTPVSPSGYQWI
jgi:hypothetical protein